MSDTTKAVADEAKVFPLYCSFCGKSDTEVATMIAGPTVFICDECACLCHELIEEKTKGPIPHDFVLTPEQLAAKTEGFKAISTVCGSVADSFGAFVEDPAMVISMVTDILIKIAAMSAIKMRRELLAGEPDPRRWRKATDEAFAFAIALDDAERAKAKEEAVQ